MNKKLMLVIFTFFICSNVFALDACTTSELSRLKELANNVEFKRNYKITEDEEEHAIDVLYNIDIINRDKDLKIYYKTAYDTEKIELSSRETNVGDFAPTENVTFYIHAYAENACITKLLKTVTVKLPVYNEYYYFHKDKCGSYPNFKYCQEFLDTEKGEAEIDKLFDEYIESTKPKSEVKKDSKTYLYFGILAGVVVIAIVVVAIIKINKKKKDDL